MRTELRGDEAGPANGFAEAAQRVYDPAAAIAHYKKMYDRSSALARIGVWEFDLATETLTWTDGVYDLFDLPRGSPIERTTALQFYEDESRLEMERLRAAAIRDGGSFVLDIRIRTAAGNPRWLRLTADVEREDGISVRIFGTKQDITLEKVAQEKVRLLQTELIHVSRRSAMGVMASTLAHELNQPLAAISNYAAGTRRALSSGEPGKEVVERGLEEIEKCAFRAGSIIRSLREMTGEGAGRRQPTDLSALAREAGSLATAGGGEIAALRYELTDGLLVSADPVQIQQVLINLIRNAFEAVQDVPVREIAVSTLLAGNEACLRVEDSGPGIPPEIMETLFNSFVTSKPDGMGVGLSICRTIVETHGGRISAANRPSGGACFCVTLPLSD